MISKSLEKTIFHFASYASILGRKGYAQALIESLRLQEPEKTAQLDILKSSMIEIFNINSSNLEFREFIDKYNLSVDDIKEFLLFLEEDFGFNYFDNEKSIQYITIPSFLKTKLEEKLYDEVSFFIKLKLGRKYWEEIEYKEANMESLDKLTSDIYNYSPILGVYIQNSINQINS